MDLSCLLLICCTASNLSISNGDLDFYARLDTDGGDLLDNLGGTVQIDQPLVDSHLEAIPGLGTLSTRGLTGGDAQNLGRHTHWSLDLQVLVLGSTDQIGTYFFQT